MTISSQQYEQICKFLDADMNIAEMLAFEAELENNAEMRQQLDFEQAIREMYFIQQQTPIVASTPVAQVAIIKENNKKVYQIFNFQTTAVAAAILLIVISSLLFTNNKNLDDQRQFVIKEKESKDQQNLKHDDTAQQPQSHPKAIQNQLSNTDTLLFAKLFHQYFVKDSPPESAPIILSEALTDYENGSYQKLKAIDIANLPNTRGGSIDSKDYTTYLAHYYMGIACLDSKNTKAAISHLQWVTKHVTSETMQAKANWYLALAYLKNVEKEKAVLQLTLVVASKVVPFNKKATSLIEVLATKK